MLSLSHADAARWRDFHSVGCPSVRLAVAVALISTWFAGSAGMVEGAEPIRTLVGHEGSVRSVEFSPDGRRLVSSSTDLTAKVWDLDRGELLQTLDHRQQPHHQGAVYNVSVSPVGGIVATASGSGGDNYDDWKSSIRLWDMETGKWIATFPSQQREVFHVDFSDDGTQLVSGGSDGVVRLWNVASKGLIASLPGHSSNVWVVAFRPGSKEVASAGFDGSVKFWDIDSRKMRRSIDAHAKRIEAMAFSPDGALVATGSLDRSLKLWNVDRGDLVATMSGHRKELWSVAFSPDGKQLASAAQDRTIRIWDVATESEIRTLDGHAGGVQSVGFSPDGMTLVSSANDRTIQQWDASKFSVAADRLEQDFDLAVPGLLAKYKVPGVAIGIVRQGETALIKTYGLANQSLAMPINEATLFNVGSVSKVATAWGVMQLVEQGKIDLDEPVSRYLRQPDFRDSEFDSAGITARRLLSHTAGLSMHSIPGFRNPKPLPTLVDIFDGNYRGNVYCKPGSPLELISAPGSKWQYSGGGTMILQLLVEQMSGAPFDRHMRSAVLDRLNMQQSQFGWSEAIAAQVAVPYSPKGRPRRTYRFTGTAGAGLYSTIGDMSRLAAAGLQSDRSDPGRGVVSPQSIAKMYQPVRLTDGTASRCGLGYFVDRSTGANPRRVHHDGSNYGWRAELIAMPESKDAIVVLSNSDNAAPLIEQIVCLWEQATPGIAIPICDRINDSD